MESCSSHCWRRRWRASGALFPPGATICPGKARVRSRWREFQFALHRILAAITPPISFQAALNQWNQIAADLAEASRKRLPQIEGYR